MRAKPLDRPINKKTSFNVKAMGESWDILFTRVRAMGADEAKISWARSWIGDHLEVLRVRNDSLGLRTILSFLVRGIYFSHLSGLRSLARDLLDLARERRSGDAK
jgi:hypothetical protein